MPESMRPLRTSSKALKMLLTAQHPPVSGQYWEVRPDRKLQHGRRPDRRVELCHCSMAAGTLMRTPVSMPQHRPSISTRRATSM